MSRLMLNRDLLKLTLFTLLQPVLILGGLHIMNIFLDIEAIAKDNLFIGLILSIFITICGAYVFIGIPVLFPEKFSEHEDSGLFIFVPFTTSSFVITGALLFMCIQAVWKYVKGLLLIAIAIILSVYTGIYLLIFMLIINGYVKKGVCKEKTHDRLRAVYYVLYDKDLDFGYVNKLMDKFNRIKCV